MACYHPLTVWQSKMVNPDTGKKFIFFSSPSMNDLKMFDPIQLPCGKCIGCRLKYSRDWALRCVHEAKLHDRNCFITLTYDDDHIHWSEITGEQTLYKKDLQDFFKRLRRHIEPAKLRFYACGEYGDVTHRPHYHAIIFGYDFPDKKFFKIRGSYPTYISDLLTKIWKNGNTLVAGVSFDSCAYVARYVLKKLNGELANEKYEGIQKEFVNMSRRPGIARDFYDKYKNDIFPYDECIVTDNGKVRKCKPSRYYDRLFDIEQPDLMEEVKNKRKIQALKNSDVDSDGYISDERLADKESYTLAKLSKLKRSL